MKTQDTQPSNCGRLRPADPLDTTPGPPPAGVGWEELLFYFIAGVGIGLLLGALLNTGIARGQAPPPRTAVVTTTADVTGGILKGVPDPLRVTITNPPALRGTYLLTAAAAPEWHPRAWVGKTTAGPLKLGAAYVPTGAGGEGCWVLTIITPYSQEKARGYYPVKGGPLTFTTPGGLAATCP